MIIVSGTFRIAPEAIAAWRPHAAAMQQASRAEDGCRTYTYAHDAEDAGLIRVYEEWESREALSRHFETEHMKAWRAALAEVGAHARDIRLFEASAGEPV